MSKISLKHIIGRRNDPSLMLSSFIGQLESCFSIEDETGNILFRSGKESNAFQYPVLLGDQILGRVTGDKKAGGIAALLSLLAQKELARKEMANEVLLLYKEVNMIFDFSDKLAQAIGTDTIAQITVEEAMQLIPSAGGAVILWDENSKQLQIPATAGARLFDEKKIADHAGLLLQIGLSGNSEIMSDLQPLTRTGITGPQFKSLIYAALKVKHRIMGAIILARKDEMQYAAADLKFLTTLALQSSSAIESALLYEKNIREVKEQEEAMRRIYEITGKFVPYEFIGSLGHKVITEVKLGDQVEKVVTVLFTDIRDYTALSERMTPEENFQFVCSYNERMGPVIRRRNGFINQYLGDAVMALFPQEPEDALHAAIEMQKEVRKFNSNRKGNNLDPIKMGVGMHTGPLIMGITGDKDRLDATTISDTVNTASRIESLTKYYKASILLSDAIVKQLARPEDFHLRYLGLVQVKGKQAYIGIHECFGSDTDDEINKKEKALSLFHEGVHHYLHRSFADAVKAFQAAKAIHPEDRTVEFFLDKALHYLQQGSPENWTGVVAMQNK